MSKNTEIYFNFTYENEKWFRIKKFNVRDFYKSIKQIHFSNVEPLSKIEISREGILTVFFISDGY